jgi:hypothetical protein
MLQRVLRALLACSFALFAGIPTPQQHFGYEPGADYKLASYDEIIGYFKKLDAASDRLTLVEYGKTSLGKPSYLAFISSEENLRDLDRYKAINRKLALAQVATQTEAAALARDGRAFVWIDSGLHSTEVAPAQHAPVLAHKMLSDESDETKRIRANVILIQVPVINPDGLEMVVEWYRKNVGTPHELAPLPKLYQKYSGHDNNRDWYMMNLQETRNVSRLLFHEWFPQIVYNQHQQPAFPARIFVPPYAEPLNPNIPAAVMEGINLIGSAMKERFAREDKPGVLSYFGFDGWWNGGLRSVPAFHNMHGILTETALNGYATPRTYKPSELPERFANGIPTKEPTIFYERPWLGGKWGTKDAIDYMITADFAILDLASTRREQFLMKAWQMARNNIEAGKRGKPYAYIITPDQWDSTSALEMLRRLLMGGVVVHRAKEGFTAAGTTYDAGTHVLLTAQPFRSYLVDLMEPQKYPDLRTGTGGTVKRPYDVAGWTLPMQMGVRVARVEEPFDGAFESVEDITIPIPALNSRDNSSFLAVIDVLSKNEPLRWSKNGKLVRRGDAGWGSAAWELRTPRVAVYEPWTANMDAGWTQWVLDHYRVPYTLVHNADIAKGSLRARFDAIIFAAQTTNGIMHGFREGEASGRRPGDANALQRAEYTGGIGLPGAAALQAFAKEGGTLIAFDEATDLPVQLFPLPVRPLITSGASENSYFSPGSIIRVTVDDTHPIAFGMPTEAYVFQSGGQAWEPTLVAEHNKGERQVNSVARYAAKNLLASGWVSGERAVLGKTILAEARYGDGRVVLFGFSPQFRGQSFGTFKFLLNAIYLASAKPL